MTPTMVRPPSCLMWRTVPLARILAGPSTKPVFTGWPMASGMSTLKAAPPRERSTRRASRVWPAMAILAGMAPVSNSCCSDPASRREWERLSIFSWAL